MDGGCECRSQEIHLRVAGYPRRNRVQYPGQVPEQEEDGDLESVAELSQGPVPGRQTGFAGANMAGYRDDVTKQDQSWDHQPAESQAERAHHQPAYPALRPEDKGERRTQVEFDGFRLRRGALAREAPRDEQGDAHGEQLVWEVDGKLSGIGGQ